MSSSMSNVNSEVLNVGKPVYMKKNDDGAAFLYELLKDAPCNERSKTRLTGTMNFIRVIKPPKTCDFIVVFDEGGEENIANVKMSLFDSKNKRLPRDVVFSTNVNSTVKEHIRMYLQQLIHLTLKHWGTSTKDNFFHKNDFGESMGRYRYDETDKEEFKKLKFDFFQFGMIFRKQEGELFAKVYEESEQTFLGEITLQPAISSRLRMYDTDKQYIPRWETAKDEAGKNIVVPLRLGGKDGMSALAKKFIFQSIVMGDTEGFNHEISSDMLLNHLDQYKKKKEIKRLTTRKFRNEKDNRYLLKLKDELVKLQEEVIDPHTVLV